MTIMSIPSYRRYSEKLVAATKAVWKQRQRPLDAVKCSARLGRSWGCFSQATVHVRRELCGAWQAFRLGFEHGRWSYG